MVDLTVKEDVPLLLSSARLSRSYRAERVFKNMTLACALFVAAMFLGIIWSLFDGAWPAIRAFGFGFLFTEAWNPVTERFGALAPIYGTLMTSLIAMLIAVPIGIGIAIFLTELCPRGLRRPIGVAVELLAGIPSIIYGIWGLFVLAPILQQGLMPFLIATFEGVPLLSSLFAGPPYGIGIFTAGLILAIMTLPFVAAITRDVFETVPPVLEGSGLRAGRDRLGSAMEGRASLCAGRRRRRRDARARPRARRDDGRHLRDRQRAPDLGLPARARNDDLGRHRERVHRSVRRALHRLAGRARPDPVLRHLPGARRGAIHALSPGAPRGRTHMNNGRYLRRRIRSGIFLGLLGRRDAVRPRLARRDPRHAAL